MKLEIKVNNEIIEPELASDMFYMTGWEDSENVKICQFVGSTKTIRTEPIHGNYLGYVGNDEITLCFGKNRTLSILVNTAQVRDKMPEIDYDYAMRTYHFSSILNTLTLDDLQLDAHVNRGDNYITITWLYEDDNYEIHIGIDL